MLHPFLQSLLGGVVIGVAASLFLIFNGRVAGFCGILSGLLEKKVFSSNDFGWRLAFILGTVFSGFVVFVVKPEMFVVLSDRSNSVVIAAGLLVGFGSLMGNGCTSGHAVCGLSRLSIRSLVATATFMACGILVATVFSYFDLAGAL